MKRDIFPVIVFLSMVLILGSSLTSFASTTGVAIDDAAITTKVKHELAEDVILSTMKTVQVDTNRGEVTLTGKVLTEGKKT